MNATSPRQQDVQRFADMLSASQRIAFLTGAGMSTESGIPDFRSASGIYAKRANESVFDVRAFERDPSSFFAFAKTFYAEVRRAEPNAGHRAITALQQRFGKHVDVATQNIDTLHQRAGAENVYPVHGTVDTVTCTRCGDQQYTDTIWDDVDAGIIPRHVKCGGVYKPDIVFFGEMLPIETLRNAERAIETADLVVVLGTSLTVYPAAALPMGRRAGVPLVIVNRTSTALDDSAALCFRDAIGTILPAAIALMDEA